MLGLLALLLTSTSASLAVEISYQGRLVSDGELVGLGGSDDVDMYFKLYDAELNGNHLQTLSFTGLVGDEEKVNVQDGLFNVVLSFNDSYFESTAERWLEVTYDGEAFPRQKLTIEPRSQWAADASHADEADAASYAQYAATAGSASTANHATSAYRVLASDGSPIALSTNAAGDVEIGSTGSLPSYVDLKLSRSADPVFAIEDQGDFVSYLAANGYNGSGSESTILGSEGDIELKTGVSFGSGPIYSGTTRLKITTAGSIGMGTIYPSARLHVYPATEEAILGKARVGGGIGYGYASFGHQDFTASNKQSPSDYAIAQDSEGNTFVNSSTGKAIYFKTNNEGSAMRYQNRVLSFNPAVEPAPESYAGKIFALTNAYLVTNLWVRASEGSAQQITSHASPQQVDPLAATSFDGEGVDLPWSVNHKNSFIGKGAIVDMAKLVDWAEEKMQSEMGSEEGKLIYSYDLSEEEIVSLDDYYVNSLAERVEQELLQNRWVEVPLKHGDHLPSDALVEEEIMEEVEVQKTVTERKIDFEAGRMIETKSTVTAAERRGTGRFHKVLAENYRFVDGKLLRRRTAEDVDIEKLAKELPPLPDWVMDRIPESRRASNSLGLFGTQDEFDNTIQMLRPKVMAAYWANQSGNPGSSTKSGAPQAIAQND